MQRCHDLSWGNALLLNVSFISSIGFAKVGDGHSQTTSKSDSHPIAGITPAYFAVA
jgi:hypothetical protein